MERLSIQQIQDYNNRDAFTRLREQNRSVATNLLSEVVAENSRSVKTASLSESYTLLSGLDSRLNMIEANMVEMLKYAKAGSSASNEQERDEYIGLIRSLSGGLDDIVDQTVWNEQKTLDGRGLELNLGDSGSSPKRSIELSSYYSSDEDGLNLTSQPASGKASVFYDYYSAYRNQESGLIGLDISDSFASPVNSTKNELETDTYKLEISYAGPDSSISIKTLDGTLLNTVNGVDLSGTGQELVDLEVGVSLSIQKEQFLQSIDKYDYENEGPATLYALMDYTRVFRHEVANEGSSQFIEQDLSINYNKSLSDGASGTLSIDSLKMAGIRPDKPGLETGNYSLRVNYAGEKSSVELRNSSGNLVYLDHRIDLSGSEPVKVDTGLGISFEIDNNNFSGDSGQMFALFEYQAAGNNNAEFDFNAYAARIEQALDSLQTDREVIWAAQDEILTINQYRSANFSASGSVTSGALVGSMLSSLAGDSSGIFGAGNANAQLAGVADALFAGTSSAISAQGSLGASRLA